MNITAIERKIFNKIKHNQIEEIDSTNFGEAAFRAGQLDMAILLMNLRNGELSEHQVEQEMAKLETVEMVN